MLNIVLPMAGISPIAEELGYPYPSPLVEINGVPLIERVINNLKELGSNIRFLAILRSIDCRKYHLDSTIQLLCGNNSSILILEKETAGALCSLLMGIENFYDNNPLIIANTDQIFKKGVLQSLINKIYALSPDAALPSFNSVHPRWSYLRLNENQVTEVVEKKPISRNAIAGLYYFKSGKIFAEAAMKAILNERNINGRFFISSALNELLLQDYTVVSIPIENSSYYSLFTAQRVNEFEKNQIEF